MFGLLLKLAGGIAKAVKEPMKAVKQAGKVVSQARLDEVAAVTLGGLAFAVSNENWDTLGKSISQSMR